MNWYPTGHLLENVRFQRVAHRPHCWAATVGDRRIEVARTFTRSRQSAWACRVATNIGNGVWESHHGIGRTANEATNRALERANRGRV